MRLNPGHLDALRKLGIIGEQEDSISSQELAERVINSPDASEALSIIRQEAANITMSIEVIIQTIEDIEAMLPRLNTREAILQELTGLSEEVMQLPGITHQVVEMDIFAQTISIIAEKQQINFSSEMQRQLLALEEMLGQADNVSLQVEEYLVRGKNIVEQLVKKLAIL